MSKYLKLIWFMFAVIFLSGCSFSNSSKKSEITLNNNQSIETQAEITTENNNSQASDTSKENQSDSSEKSNDSATPKNEAIKSSEPSLSSQEDKKSEDVTSANPPTFKIIDRLVGWGFTASSGRKIDTIIIHSSYNAVGSDEHSLDDIINKEYKPVGVSPHYIISRAGKVYRLVKDKNIAYHAGVSKVPDGRTNVNDFSLGIEIVETNKETPNSDQYIALKSLLIYLKDEYKIKYVLGHSDIAPDRKSDPWNFDWDKIK